MRFGVCALLGALVACVAGETFNETLDLRTLPGGRVHAAFSFALHSDDASLHHFRLLPRGLLQPVASLDVDAFQLSLTAGRWQYGTWGAQLGSQSAASGAEVWASFGKEHSMPLATRWRRLTSALAGTFCASLDAIDDATSVEVPAMYAWSDAPANASMLHAYLPSESVCTENITPLLKLLPCKGGAGLASLIQPHTILKSEFHSISVRVRRTASGYTVVLGVEVVMRPPSIEHTGHDWTLDTLFSRGLDKACPVADASAVRLVVPHKASVTPVGRVVDDDEDDEWHNPYTVRTDEHVYDTTRAPFALAFHAGHAGPFMRRAPLQASRQVLGYGQEKNLVRLTLHNDLPTETVYVQYYDQLPWVVAPLMHTLHTSLVQNAQDDEETVRYRDDFDTPFVAHAHYQPSQLRNKTGAVELTLRVPAASTLTVTYTIVKRVLHYDEHVPDPHRGIDLPPALFVPVVHGRPWAYVHRQAPVHAVQSERIYAPPSLLDIAVPDFSMPYNIILFYSTFVALFFGSMLNLMVRQFYDVVIE